MVYKSGKWYKNKTLFKNLQNNKGFSKTRKLVHVSATELEISGSVHERREIKLCDQNRSNLIKYVPKYVF